MKYTKYILSLMFLASLNGCIKEDMSDCPGNCLLEFSYVGDGTTQIFQDKIHKVTCMFLIVTVRCCLLIR